MASINLEPTTGPQGIVELQLQGVKTIPDLIEVVEEPHVPDIEIWGEEAVRAVLRQYSYNKTFSEWPDMLYWMSETPSGTQADSSVVIDHDPPPFLMPKMAVLRQDIKTKVFSNHGWDSLVM